MNSQWPGDSSHDVTHHYVDFGWTHGKVVNGAGKISLKIESSFDCIFFLSQRVSQHFQIIYIKWLRFGWIIPTPTNGFFSLHSSESLFIIWTEFRRLFIFAFDVIIMRPATRLERCFSMLLDLNSLLQLRCSRWYILSTTYASLWIQFLHVVEKSRKTIENESPFEEDKR